MISAHDRYNEQALREHSRKLQNYRLEQFNKDHNGHNIYKYEQQGSIFIYCRDCDSFVEIQID